MVQNIFKVDDLKSVVNVPNVKGDCNKFMIEKILNLIKIIIGLIGLIACKCSNG